MSEKTDTTIDSVTLATELTIAWLSNANTRTNPDDVPAFLTSMHTAITGLGGSDARPAAEEVAQEHVPAVSVRKSLASKDHIISMIDGKPYKTLRRHLATNGLSPDEYRQRYGLKPDYPMVAENYSESRRAMAKSIGLGRKPGQKPVPAPKAEESAASPPKKARKGSKSAQARGDEVPASE
jgi:predicted transcriptional regulator